MSAPILGLPTRLAGGNTTLLITATPVSNSETTFLCSFCLPATISTFDGNVGGKTNACDTTTGNNQPWAALVRLLFSFARPNPSLVKTALAIYLETENNSGERLGKSAGLCSDLTYAPVMEMLVARQMHAIRRMVPINRGLLVRPLANTDKQT